MAREFAKAFYSSKRWQRCRDTFIAQRISEDGGLCQVCHDKTGFIVHHKVKLSPKNIDNPSVTLNPENLEYVCLDCHNAIHFADWQHLDYVFVDGQPVPSPIEK